MKILLTGGNGFLGKYVRKAFVDEQITTIGLEDCDINCNLAEEIPEFKQSFNLVIHAAGKAHSTPITENDEKDFFNVNFNGTNNLLLGLEKWHALPTSFIFISSVAVYGIESGQSITEDHDTYSRDPYGLSKILAENHLVEWGKKYKINIVIMRPPIILGLKAPGNLKSMINGIRTQRYFNIEKGKARRSMVLAEDLVNFIPNILNIEGTFNLTDGYHPSFRELSFLIAKTLMVKPPRNISFGFAFILACIGDLITSYISKKFPFNREKLFKMTSDLTFNDSRARLYGWNPRKVIDFPELWID